jgi:hypothetical protein
LVSGYKGRQARHFALAEARTWVSPALLEDKRDASRIASTQRVDLTSPYAGAAAALALHHLVALLQEPLAFAVLALWPLLDVRAFDVVHDGIQSMMRGACRQGICLAGV